MTAAVARSLRLFCPDFNLLLCYIWRDSFSSRSTANGGGVYEVQVQWTAAPRQTDRQACVCLWVMVRYGCASANVPHAECKMPAGSVAPNPFFRSPSHPASLFHSDLTLTLDISAPRWGLTTLGYSSE